jgi:hypothetical protein
MRRAALVTLLSLAAGGALATAAILTRSDLSSGEVRGAGRRDDAIPELIAAMRGVNETACELAGMGLRNGGWGGMFAGVFAEQNEERVVEVLRDVLQQEVAAADVPALRTALGDPDACVARTAARILGRARTAGAVGALRDAVRSGGSALLPGIIGLAHADDLAAAADLRPLLRNDAARVRRAAAWALGSIEDEAAIPELARLLQSDPDPAVRRTAAWALGSMD